MVLQPLEQAIHEFVLRDFPAIAPAREEPASDPLWQRMVALGSELWLDTGSIGDARRYWTREFTALTTNNTLLNKEVQNGQYDNLIARAGELLGPYHLDETRQRLELAFILNAYHGLRLVQQFDAHVSVEEHTDLAQDVEQAVAVAHRYHAICPDRFIIKIPFTPAGLLATRRLSDEGIPVNHTLGFSARQNYIIARLGRPRFVNVFLGRLNQFVVDNKLGDGLMVGERATLASQMQVADLRQQRNVPSRQIAASFRSAQQVADLAGVDVLTIPPKVAGEFLDLDISPEDLADHRSADYQPTLNQGVDPAAIGLDTLWDVDDRLIDVMDRLEKGSISAMSAERLVDAFHDGGCGSFMPRWTGLQRETSRQEGKIPKLDNWRRELAAQEAGLDALMNLAGLMSFTADQEAMDARVAQALETVRR